MNQEREWYRYKRCIGIEIKPEWLKYSEQFRVIKCGNKKENSVKIMQNLVGYEKEFIFL